MPGDRGRAPKATPRSVRVYFLIAGALSGWSNALAIAREHGMAIVLAAIGLVFAVGFVVAGIRLPHELAKGATWIKQMILAVIGFQGIQIALLLSTSHQRTPMVWLGVSLLLAFYLYVSVSQVADDDRSQPPR